MKRYQMVEHILSFGPVIITLGDVSVADGGQSQGGEQDGVIYNAHCKVGLAKILRT